jgi:uncharacterized protein
MMRPAILTPKKFALLAALTAAGLSMASCAIPATGNNSDSGGCNAGAAQGKSPAGLNQVSLCITSKGKVHAFTVEVAASPDEQQKGLMFRTALSDKAGMIFPQAQPRVASFWMKNTVISLDIIFIKPDGTIENIAANTTPYSTDSVSSTAEVGSVLELRAGLTKELGIGPGDVVSWKTK